MISSILPANFGNVHDFSKRTDLIKYIKKVDTDESLYQSYFNKPIFLKIDVEGYEKQVLSGGLQTIKKYKPIIYVENNSNTYNSSIIKFFKKKLLRYGYAPYMFNFNKIYHPTLFTVEDTSMSKPIFQTLRAEMMRKNDFSVAFKEEKPGTRMSKRDRIQEILAQRFSVGQIRIKRTQYDLQREIITFGPRMAHDDTIDALAYACKFAYPIEDIEKDKSGRYVTSRPKAKPWITA